MKIQFMKNREGEHVAIFPKKAVRDKEGVGLHKILTDEAWEIKKRLRTHKECFFNMAGQLVVVFKE